MTTPAAHEKTAPIEAVSKPDPRDDLRERLLAMRDRLIEALAAAPLLEMGYVRQLADVDRALRAIEGIS